ncbi:MAG: peptidylprolyl isomerase [Caldimicrobium sp.]
MRKFLLVLGLSFFCLWSLPVKLVLAEKVLAEVGPYKLFEEDLEAIMKGDPQVREILKVKPELKNQIQKTLIERWINISLLALAAKEEKLNENPTIKKKILENEKMILAEEFLQRKLFDLKVSEEEMKQYYEKHKANYREPEAVQLKHILIFVDSKEGKSAEEKALNRAKQIRGQLIKGAKFEELAKVHSDDLASRDKGGDLGILRKGDTIPEFEEKVFSLKAGEISEPIRSPYGYHIVKVVKKIPASQLSFEAVKDKVKEDILKEKEKEKLEKEIESLRKKFSPVIY